MSLQIFKPRRRPLTGWRADLRELGGVCLAFAALAALEGLIRHLGAPL